jgi:hypothetical protein
MTVEIGEILNKVPYVELPAQVDPNSIPPIPPEFRVQGSVRSQLDSSGIPACVLEIAKKRQRIEEHKGE